MPVCHAVKVSIFLSEILKSDFFTTYYKQKTVPWLISSLFHKQRYNQAVTKGPRKQLSDRSSYGQAVSLHRNKSETSFPQKLLLLGHREVVPPAKIIFVDFKILCSSALVCKSIRETHEQNKFQPTPPKNWKRRLAVQSNLPKATTQNAQTQWSLTGGGLLRESNHRRFL